VEGFVIKFNSHPLLCDSREGVPIAIGRGDEYMKNKSGRGPNTLIFNKLLYILRIRPPWGAAKRRGLIPGESAPLVWGVKTSRY